MPLVGFELTISAGKRPQTYALDRAATGTGIPRFLRNQNIHYWRTKHNFFQIRRHKILQKLMEYMNNTEILVFFLFYSLVYFHSSTTWETWKE